MPEYIDWEFAKSTGRTLVSAGPRLTPQEAAREVSAIREAARAAYTPVAETARLHTPPNAPAAVVVDRPTWIARNADSMRDLLAPAVDELLARRSEFTPHPLVASIGGKLTGGEAGALFAFLASKVLGQYDLAPGGTPQLMLVAPNLLQVQRDLDLDAADFRAWVCLHEETHRVQFTAVPWLREHLIAGSRALVVDLAPDPDRLQELVKGVGARLREAVSEGGLGLADLLTTPEQRAELAQLTAVMSLLEGHADVVMDDVGPAHVPSVAVIRERFERRRDGVGLLDKVLRRLLGLEAKMRQYRDGARFVRAVQDQVGVDGFNAVWTAPDTLPSPAEIADPGAWVRRIHG